MDQSEKSEDRGRLRRIRANDNNYSGVDNADDGNKVGGPSIELSGTRLPQNYIICPPLTNSSTTRPSLGITLPYLYLTVHVPQQLDFSFEVTILDDKRIVRRFRASTYQSTTTIKPDICTLPLTLERQQGRLTRDAILLPTKKQKVDFNHHNPYAECNSYDNSSYYGTGTNNGEEDDDEEDDDYNDNKISCWNRLCIPLSEYTKRAYGTNYVETMSVQVHANCLLKRVYFAEKEVNEDDELPEEFRLYDRPS